MFKEDVTDSLISELEQMGWKARVVPIEVVAELEEAYRRFHEQGAFDEEFYQEWLAERFKYSPADARSLIVVAVPNPHYEVRFTWQGEAHTLTVPPNYLSEKLNDQKVKNVLEKILASQGCYIVESVLPKKLLAVRSGLGEYGRNNICYVDGMGSYHNIGVFFSDVPCQADEWREPQMAETCCKCTACIRACPSGAISPERFLLKAELCLTYRNEKPGHVPFPSWVDSDWHNCLVGCLHCQSACPMNKKVEPWVEMIGSFTQEETELIMKGTPAESLPAATVEKLESHDLISYLDVMPRNLDAIIKR